MADSKSQKQRKADIESWKPGSEPERAREVADGGDFGVPAGTRPDRERQYVSENTRMSDPGVTQPMDWERDGVRDHGAGAPDSGPGSGSAGDLDPDIIGFGTGGVAATAPDDAPGPDDTDGSSDVFASALPDKGKSQAQVIPAHGANQTHRHEVGSGGPVRGGHTAFGDIDMQTAPVGQGADAATNAARGDDSFAGEVSSGEAQGDDLAVSPSSDTQGLSQDDNQAYPQKDVRDDA